MICREKKRYRISALQMDNLRGLLVIGKIGKMNTIPYVLIRELCGVTKGMDERIDEGVF